jgi:Family of unknown function (DUF6525)
MGQGGFKSGSYSYAKKETQWKAYDRLPPSVRAALQQAAFDWASYPVWRRFESGKVSSKELTKAIAKWDADQIKKDRKKVWG